MRFYTQALMVLSLLLTCFATTSCVAQPSDTPVYVRHRMHTQAGYSGGGGASRHVGRHAGYYPGYYRYQPVIAGSWYTRPYPHHFDYYRSRYSTPQRSDCHCAEAPAY